VRLDGENGPSIADVTRLYLHDSDDQTLLRRAVRAAALPEEWRATFLERLRRHA
jgi:MOSC domain-containing protein YiiM